MAVGLTPKQKRVFDFIGEFGRKNGYAPSQHEIAKHFGFQSLGTVQNYLVRLERLGLLKKSWNARRGVELVDPAPHTTPDFSARTVPLPGLRARASEVIDLPLVGRVAAGRPIEAIETHESIEVPASMVRGRGTHMALKVRGDSMIEDGILDGDYVIVRKSSEAVNGQTVVALINGEATIKRYQRRDSTIELLPANPAYQPIVVNSLVDGESDFHIEGVLVGVLRKLA